MIKRSNSKKLFSVAVKFFLRASLIAILWLGGTYAFEKINNLHILPHVVNTDVSAAGNIQVWWPGNNVKVGDTQPFKAMLENTKVEDYKMFWQVDGGQLNPMNNSNTDYPHKEAVVDLKSWNWRGGGPYTVTFVATDNNGTALTQNSVQIYTTESALNTTVAFSNQPQVQNQTNNPTSGNSVTQSVAQVVSAGLGLPSVSANTVVTSETPQQSNNNQNSNQQSQPTAHQNSAITSNTVGVMWPAQNETISGIQPFKAVLSNTSPSQYKMFWQVDGGQMNEMGDNSTDGAHKEEVVDLSGWNWKGSNPYTISFIAQDLQGNILGKTDISVHISNAVTTNKSSVQNQSQSSNSNSQTVSTSQPTISQNVVSNNYVSAVSTSVSSNSGNPLQGARLYVNQNSDAVRQVNEWKWTRPGDADKLEKIANAPEVEWLGNWNWNISNDVSKDVANAQSQGAVPVFVAYNIPNRDCGQYSAGGENSPDGYRSWMQKIADAIGGSKATVILEPDALSLTSCLSSSDLQIRNSLINDAIRILKSKGNIAVYLDAGHPGWISAEDMANKLKAAGIGAADGFALNISNFVSTQENATYGQHISDLVGGKHFIVDTSRNGKGAPEDNQWCNPQGRAIGAQPTTNTGYPLIDAFLWVKGPGGSDGNCNGGPSAGNWWADYALDLAKNSDN